MDAIKKITNKHLKSISYFSELILEEKIKNEKNTTDSEKHVCVKTDGIVFTFKTSLEPASDIDNNK